MGGSLPLPLPRTYYLALGPLLGRRCSLKICSTGSMARGSTRRGGEGRELGGGDGHAILAEGRALAGVDCWGEAEGLSDPGVLEAEELGMAVQGGGEPVDEDTGGEGGGEGCPQDEEELEVVLECPEDGLGGVELGEAELQVEVGGGKAEARQD